MINVTRTLTILLGLSLLIATSGCEKDAGETKKEKTSSEETEQAKDQPEMPETLKFAFQPQENPDALAPDAEKLADYMTEKTGIESEVFLPTSYASVVEALRSDNADVAYFSGWPYMVAHREADVELIAAEVRDGNPFYHSQWFVAKDSDIKTLSDLEGKAIAFTSPTSTSGYLFPLAKVIEETDMETGDDPKKFFGEVIYAGGYEQSLKSLVHGKVDAAAASDYAFDQYLTDDERADMRVLSKQGPVPTHGIAVRSELPDEVKDKIEKSILELNEPENKELLESIYGATELTARSHDEHVAPLEEALKLVGSEKDIKGFGAGSGSGSGHGHEEGEGSGSGSGHGHKEGEGSGSGSGESH
ncbi:MAG: phosphate/phosphite/phosphonate ABC transporter substrate-binding protein [Myxococcota bacterium]